MSWIIVLLLACKNGHSECVAFLPSDRAGVQQMGAMEISFSAQWLIWVVFRGLFVFVFVLNSLLVHPEHILSL